MLHGLFWLGWGTVLVSTSLISHFELFGLRQVWLYFSRREYQPVGFQTSLLYKLGSAPDLSWLPAGLLIDATMTIGHSGVLAGRRRLYFVGIKLEERDLLRFHGEAYQHYRQQVHDSTGADTGRFAVGFQGEKRCAGLSGRTGPFVVLLGRRPVRVCKQGESPFREERPDFGHCSRRKVTGRSRRVVIISRMFDCIWEPSLAAAIWHLAVHLRPVRVPTPLMNSDDDCSGAVLFCFDQGHFVYAAASHH